MSQAKLFGKLFVVCRAHEWLYGAAIGPLPLAHFLQIQWTNGDACTTML